MPSSSRESSLPELQGHLLVALSGRALAVAARRAGYEAYVLDLFGDSDMRTQVAGSMVVPGSLERGFDEVALIAAAGKLVPSHVPPRHGLVYGAGLEDRPQLLAELCRGRQLFGNPPKVVRLTKDPRSFFEILERLHIPHPGISFQHPTDPEAWLVKRVGASGGTHVVPAAAAGGDGEGRYYQQRVPGRPVGASFLADGKHAFLLGFSEQWSWPGKGGAPSFRFGGAFQPAPVAPKVVEAVDAVLDALVPQLGLVGLNSLDMLVDGDRFAVIEVNPRPGANLDILDGGDHVPLFELHLRACAGDLPIVWHAPKAATAMAVVYGDQPSHAPANTDWPDWVADRPAPGQAIDAGGPVCTVLASAPTTDGVRKLVDQRVAEVLARLRPDRHDQPPRPGAGAAGEAVGPR
jgi:predicted ATP-grasp superfamily ATP-dependent carboligase